MHPFLVSPLILLSWWSEHGIMILYPFICSEFWKDERSWNPNACWVSVWTIWFCLENRLAWVSWKSIHSWHLLDVSWFFFFLPGVSFVVRPIHFYEFLLVLKLICPVDVSFYWGSVLVLLIVYFGIIYRGFCWSFTKKKDPVDQIYDCTS